MGRLAVAQLIRRRYPLTSDTLLFSIWRVIGAVELAIGACLLSGFDPRSTGIVTAAMAAAGTGYVAMGLSRASGSSCGCFGTSGPISRGALARAAIMLLAATAYAVVGASPWGKHLANSGLAVAVVLGTELLAIAVCSLDELARAASAGRLGLRIAIAYVVDRYSMDAAQDEIESSPYWQSLTESDVEKLECVVRWRRRGWVLCQYAARWSDRDVTIIAGASALHSPRRVRVLAVSESGEGPPAVLAAFDSLFGGGATPVTALG